MLLHRNNVLATINRRKFGDLAAAAARTTTPDSARREKYLDLPKWIDINLRRIRTVGLAGTPPRRVLDLGCGCGYFLHIARMYGHAVLGVDYPEGSDSLFVQVRELLGVPWIPHDITADSPPPVGTGWDVVTAHMVCFNGHCTDKLWGAPEWERLLDAIPAPVWSIELNAEHGTGLLFPPGLREFFEARGAKVSGHHVLLDRRSSDEVVEG